MGQVTLGTTKIALITDNHVGGLYAEKSCFSLEHEGFEVVVFKFSRRWKRVKKILRLLIRLMSFD